MPSALAVEHVVKVYPEGTRALDDVSFTVEAGETVALVGESGSGKTTLLRLFKRRLLPTSGRVVVEGEDIAGVDPIALRRRLGYVPQDGGLLPHWTVGKNVETVPRLLGWEPARRRERIKELLDLVGLSDSTYAGRYPNELSGGQRQRVAFARALAADPPILLLDEPFGALDALTRRELHQHFAEWTAALGKAAILVTHDLAEAFRLAARTGVLRGGRLLQIGPAEDLERRPADPYVEALLDLALSRRSAHA
ncbi:MAG TPA: ATP-binding cassette domain-containing protein [Thermoanaerobaculia bacterium]|nr:ATP-binding cassette domain-containing protein [Thermoanaerobaculia bacterium]